MKNLYYYKFELIRVIDGDTVVGNIDLGFNLKMNNVYVRLLNIDTMELNSSDELDRKLAKKAKSFLIKRLKDKELFIKTKKERGSFGRVLGIIYEGHDKNINLELINKGYAVPYGYEATKKEKRYMLKKIKSIGGEQNDK